MTPAIANEKYVSLTTYRKNGEPKPAPVWIADLGDGTVGFCTASSSWKVKRLANDPKVTLSPSDSKGNVAPGAEIITGTAVTSTGPDFDRVWALIVAKYGIQARGIKAFGSFMKLIGKGSGTDAAIIITLDTMDADS